MAGVSVGSGMRLVLWGWDRHCLVWWGWGKILLEWWGWGKIHQGWEGYQYSEVWGASDMLQE